MHYFLGTLAANEGAEHLSTCFYCYEGGQALRHLACVAAGMDSMVIGETEIFGQLKDAYRVAQAAGSTSFYANRTFQRIFTIGKKVRTETRITSGPTSVGAAAVQFSTMTPFAPSAPRTEPTFAWPSTVTELSTVQPVILLPPLAIPAIPPTE